jgi:hypothetical protein
LEHEVSSTPSRKEKKRVSAMHGDFKQENFADDVSIYLF